MRLKGFQCDRCGKVVLDQDFCRLSKSEVGEEFLDDYKELSSLELCDDCYEEWRDRMRTVAEDFLGIEENDCIYGFRDED